MTRKSFIEGQPSRALVKGAFLGLLVGGGTGFLVGALTYDDGDCDILVCSSAQAGTLLGLIGGVVGTPIGALVGAAKGSAEWRPVDLASVKP